MNLEMIDCSHQCKYEAIDAHPPVVKRWRQILMITAMALSFASIAFAKGGDDIAPFPVIDPLSAKQESKATAVDSVGNIIVVGYTNVAGMNNDYQITKFNANGSSVAWRATFDKSGGDDQASAVVVDSGDNIIVTGTVWNGSNTDIHTIKYGPNGGTPLWQHTWSGPYEADVATSITVDGSDNIYIAGYSFNSSANDDYLIIKYPPAGTTPEWVEIHNSSYNSNDRITSIAAGSDGIVVTGASSKAGTDFDILTRKYGFDKSLVWEQRKGSTGSGDDRGVAVQMDSTGNVYMTGYLYNGANNDIYTAKYGAAYPGAPIWEKVYAGVGNDEPRAIRVDGTDDVYVTGYTYTYSGNEDFYTVRYNSVDGTKVWDAIYNSGSDFTDIPIGMVVKNGAVGDLFVVGYTVTNVNENITTLKYGKGSGELLWQQIYNGAANKNERPVGIGLTTSGDVCIAGWTDTTSNSFDYLAIKYDFGSLNRPTNLTAVATSNTAISLSWRDNSYNESGFKVERKLGLGGSYSQIGTTGAGITTFPDSGLIADSDYYYRVRAYNAADSYYSNEAHAFTRVVSYNSPAWIYQYNGNKQDEATGIVTGSDDHPIVTGFSELEEEGVPGIYSLDYMTIKLDRGDNSVKWKARYDSGDTDMAAGIVLDNAGNAIVTGTAYLMGSGDKSDDLYTIKYNSAGYTNPAVSPPTAWGRQYGTQAGIDQATAIQALKDSSNSIVVIGHGTNIANNEDMFILKYDSEGVPSWPPIVFDGGTDGNDYPSAVALDASGNIFITGKTENAAADFDIYTAKYNGATGALIWSQIYAGAGNGDDNGLSLAVDKRGDVYVTGYSVNAAGNEEWVTIKYVGADSAANREIWKKVYNGPATPVNGNDRGIAVGIDPIDGNVVVAGTSYLTATDSDFHIIRYNAGDGATIWERNFDRQPTYDYVTAMAIDASGNIYITGNSRSGTDTNPSFDPSSNILSIIYDFEGEFLAASTFNGDLQDEARAIAANNKGESFAAGITRNTSNFDYLVLKQSHDKILVPAPLVLFPQADSTKMNITWQENTPATKFQLDRTLEPVNENSDWTPVKTADSGTTSFLDSGLSPGTGYCYRIYAYKESPTRKDSRPIIECRKTTLSATILSPLAVDSMTQITLSWSPIDGNTGYLIERSLDSVAWSTLTTVGQGVTTYSDSGLTAGTKYYYRVFTNSSSGYSLQSNVRNATTKTIAPTLTSPPTNISNIQMTLNWGAVTGASTYTLQKKLSADPDTNYSNVCAAIAGYTCNASALTPNIAYSFRVKATNIDGYESAWSNVVTATATLAAPTWGTGTPTERVYNGMTLTWVNPVVTGAGTITYTLQYKVSGGSYPNETTAMACVATTGLSCAVTGLNPNTTYFFRVKASNASGSSQWVSTEATAKTLLNTPNIVSATGGEAQVALVWDAVPGATGYTFERTSCTDYNWPPACSFDVWRYPIDVAGTTYTLGGISPGQRYRFRLYAKNSDNSSAYSNVIDAWTNLSKPTLTVTRVNSTQLNLSWPFSSGLTNFDVYLSTTGINGTYSSIYTMSNAVQSYQHTGLTPATQYCYKVKAYSTVTNHPPDVFSDPVCEITFAPPNPPVLSVSRNDLESSYSVIEDVSKYWTMADYWINRPVVITSGANTYTKRISGSLNSAFFAGPAFTTETINQGDSYVVLQTVTGKSTANTSGGTNIFYDADKNWGVNEWAGFKLRITYSLNYLTNYEYAITGNGINYINLSASARVFGADESYQIAKDFGNTGSAGTTTQLNGSGWAASNSLVGYYVMMISGSNSGHARKIIANTTTTITTDAFPNASVGGDNFLIAPVAKVAPYFGTAAGVTGFTASTMVDTGNTWQTNYTGYYMMMTSGSNQGQARLITANDGAAKTITVAPAFSSPLAAGNTYTLIPANQFASYSGTAVGSSGASKTELIDTASRWLTDWSQGGYFLMMTSGANNGQSRTISVKTGTTVTVSTPFDNFISPTDKYLIGLIGSTTGSGKLTTAVTPSSTTKGNAKLTLDYGSAEFYSAAPGFADNSNYELLSLRDLTPLDLNFDTKFDYTVLSGLIPIGASPAYLYQQSAYAALRYDFQSPEGSTYSTYISRGRITPQDNGRTTAYAAFYATIYDTRAMAGSSVKWKSWTGNQWQNYYLQMTSGPSNELVRKISSNTSDSITVNSPFPILNSSGDSYRINVIKGTAAVNGSTQDGKRNTNLQLVDSSDNTGTTLPPKNWDTDQWQGFYLYISSGPNIGLFRAIQSNTTNSINVVSAFPYQIANGDSYQIFDNRSVAQAQEAYWVTISEPITSISEMLIFPSTDVAGKLRLTKTGNSLSFQTAPSSGVWQTRRQLDLQSGDIYIPSLFHVYQQGSLSHINGTNVRTKVENFSFTVPASNTTNFGSANWKPEVGHYFRRLTMNSNPLEVAWDKLSTALDYEVERCMVDGNDPNRRAINPYYCNTYIQGQPTDGSTRIINDPSIIAITLQRSYRFRVRARYDGTYYTDWSNPQWATITLAAPTMYVPTIASTTSTQLTPNWRNTETAYGHKLFWKIRSGTTCTDYAWNSPIVLGNTWTYDHSGLTPGTFYCYKVAVTDPMVPPQSPDSPFSIIVTQTTKPAAPATVTFGVITETSVTVNWSQSYGNTGYQIDRSLDNVNWTIAGLSAQDATSFTDSGLTASTLYYYRVSANSSAGFSNTTGNSTTTTPSPPIVTATTISAARIDISWPLVLGATNYKIERKVSGGSYGAPDNLNLPFTQNYCGYYYPTVACPTLLPITNTYQNTGLLENTTYCFRLKAWNTSGGDSVYSIEKCATTLPIADQTLTATPLNSFKIRLDWVQKVCTPNPCDPPDGYEIERLVRDGNWVKIATVVGAAVTTYTDRRAIDPIKQYRYRIRSYTGALKSPYSLEAVTYTPPYSSGDNVGP